MTWTDLLLAVLYDSAYQYSLSAIVKHALHLSCFSVLLIVMDSDNVVSAGIIGS